MRVTLLKRVVSIQQEQLAGIGILVCLKKQSRIAPLKETRKSVSDTPISVWYFPGKNLSILRFGRHFVILSAAVVCALPGDNENQ